MYKLLVHVILFRIDGAAHPHYVDDKYDADNGITRDDNVREARPIHL